MEFWFPNGASLFISLKKFILIELKDILDIYLFEDDNISFEYISFKNFLSSLILFFCNVTPAAKLWPPPDNKIFFSIALSIYLPILNDGIDLAEPLTKFPDLVKTIAGLLKYSFNLDAIIPIIPSEISGSK